MFQSKIPPHTGDVLSPREPVGAFAAAVAFSFGLIVFVELLFFLFRYLSTPFSSSPDRKSSNTKSSVHGTSRDEASQKGSLYEPPSKSSLQTACFSKADLEVEKVKHTTTSEQKGQGPQRGPTKSCSMGAPRGDLRGEPQGAPRGAPQRSS